MRVLLAQGYLGDPGPAYDRVFPVGLACLATALEAAGHEPWIVDLNVGQDTWARFERELHRLQPDVVGVSLRNVDSTVRKANRVFHTTLGPTLHTIRRAAPRAVAVLGGPGFSQYPAKLMARYPFDVGVVSEAEEALVELLDHLGRPDRVAGVLWRDELGQVHPTPRRRLPDFATLPFPRRHHVDWEAYRSEERLRGVRLDIGIESTRGCPRRCAYCFLPGVNGARLRKKPVDVVLDELDYLRDTFGLERFSFVGSHFNEDPDRAIAICEALVRSGNRTPWTTWMGFRRLSPEFLGLMRDAGCVRVSFSPDGLLQPSLDRMRKDHLSSEIRASIRAVERTPGLAATWCFFATPPSTSVREQLALLATYATIHGRMPGRGRMLLNWCRVEEGTHFEQIAREDGVLPEGVEMVPDRARDIEPLFYVPPGFERWARFWDRLLDLEMGTRVGAGRVAQLLRRAGLPLRDLTPRHLRRRP